MSRRLHGDYSLPGELLKCSESNTRVTRDRRKSSTNLESPRKKPRGAGKDTEVVAEANLLSTSGTKRKASTETGTPSKKQKRGHTDTNTGESTKVSVETHSDEHPPATESPRMRTSGCDPSLCSSSPSTSTQDNRSTSDRDFDAKYVQLSKLGEGGCRSVYAGTRKTDHLPTIIKQLLEAAIDLHSEGVFHLDIKSENVLLQTGSDVPRVRIIDFGCGCFVEKTPYKRFAGTFVYAPPEIFIQGTYKAAPTTVWQLGALLYELLDGYELFTTHEYLRTRMKFIREIKELNVSQDCHDLMRM